MADIYPVILSGGSGTRLWPLSRGLYPKQFIDFGGETLFGETLERVRALKDTAAPLVICNQTHRFLAASIMQGKGMPPGADADKKGGQAKLILEPVGRNTAPAIAVAAFAALEADKNPVLLVLPSDHKIQPQERFAACVAKAVQAARRGRLVTFGVVPDRPATGYGYIIQGKSEGEAHLIEKFVEKPDEQKAQDLLAKGNCLWNSGMFVFEAAAYLQELERLSPEIYKTSLAAWNSRKTDLDFIRLDEQAFAAIPADSIDYAVMEHTQKASVVPFDAGWHDLGAWESFHEIAPCDAQGNSSVGDVELVDSQNSYVYAASRLVAGIGLKDMLVVESPDAVLVMPQGRGQDVKKLLDALKAKRRSEVDTHLKVYRPWGSYETLVLGPRFQVKRIIVKPGAALSLQLHHHRAEHWVVVNGTAQVTVGEKSVLLCENQSVYIPLGDKHRLFNPGQIDLELIEIQSGTYLGEDDIVRFEDVYGR